MNVGAVIVGGGKGRRLGKEDKALLNLEGEPLFCHAYKTFKQIKQIKQIIIVLKKKHFALAKKVISGREVLFIEGGRERMHSVYNGIVSLRKEIDYVLIHDAARPFVSRKIILNVLKELRKHPAVICGHCAKDTVKIIEKSFVKKTIERSSVFLSQTPQGFKKDLIVKAYKKFKNRKFTDDAQAVELFGQRVKVVKGALRNFKITYPDDIVLANKILK